MTGFDILVLLAMGGGATFGFLRGFVQEVFALATWILVVVVLRFAHTPATEFLAEPVGSQGGAAILAFAALFILTYSLGRLIAAQIGKRSRKSMLGPIDRVLGFGFGLVKGLVMATLLFLLIMLAFTTFFGPDADPPQWLAKSRTFPLLNATGDVIVELYEQHEAPVPEPAS